MTTSYSSSTVSTPTSISSKHSWADSVDNNEEMDFTFIPFYCQSSKYKNEKNRDKYPDKKATNCEGQTITKPYKGFLNIFYAKRIKTKSGKETIIWDWINDPKKRKK